MFIILAIYRRTFEHENAKCEFFPKTYDYRGAYKDGPEQHFFVYLIVTVANGVDAF